MGTQRASVRGRRRGRWREIVEEEDGEIKRDKGMHGDRWRDRER